MRDHGIKMHLHFLSIFFLFILLCSLTPSRAHSPYRLFKSKLSSAQNETAEYFEVTRPLPTDHQTPSCSLTLLQHDFNNTVGSPPFSANYSPPSDCPSPWSAVVLEFSASCRGEQYDRISAVWIDGVEILRTSTAEPTEQGIFWKVRKDVTRYSSVLLRPNSTVSVMLENVVNDVFTGIYHVNVSLFFYGGKKIGVSPKDKYNLIVERKLRSFGVGRKLRLYGGEDDRSVENSGSFGEKRAELGLLAEDHLEKERKMGSLTELSKELKLFGKENDEHIRKLGSFGEKRAELAFLAEESLERERELGFVSKKSKQLEVFGEEDVDGRRSRLIKEKEALPLINGEEESHFGFFHKELPLHHTLRLPSEELGTWNKWNAMCEKPADLIIPISSKGEKGFWFQIQSESDIHLKRIKIPINTHRAVLEVYVSFHSNDEFWYSNPSESYIKENNLTTGRGNGAFRQVSMTIDGLYVGSVVPFPVVFTGGINPLFWEPVVGIGAFNLPSYDLDLTPFLGNLLDGKLHSFGLSVTDGISFWLVDANLHLWLDHSSPFVAAKLVQYRAPGLSIQRKSKFQALDGKFKIEAERKVQFAGWVNSSFGNLTTIISHELKFKNSIKFKNDGNFKEVEQKVKAKMEIVVRAANSVLLLAKTVSSSKYPLRITTSTLPKEKGTYLSVTNFTHSMNEKSSAAIPTGVSVRSLSNKQESNGWMLVKDHSVLSGVATTEQTYRYKDKKGCYSRTLDASDGKLLKDKASLLCSQTE